MTFVSGMNIKNFKELYMIKLKKEKSGIFFFENYIEITLKNNIYIYIYIGSVDNSEKNRFSNWTPPPRKDFGRV